MTSSLRRTALHAITSSPSLPLLRSQDDGGKVINAEDEDDKAEDIMKAAVVQVQQVRYSTML